MVRTRLRVPVTLTFQQVLEMTESASELKFLPLPEDDPKVRQPDISVAQEVLGWAPKVPLAEGLQRTIPYFRQLVDTDGAAARTL